MSRYYNRNKNNYRKNGYLIVNTIDKNKKMRSNYPNYTSYDYWFIFD